MNTALKTTLGALAVSLAVGVSAQAQTTIFTFSDATSDGWVNGGFGNSPASTVVGIGANNYIQIPLGGFQVANVNSSTVSGAPAATFNASMLAALMNPGAYSISFNYYIDTSTFTTAGSYLQAGVFLNAGSGYYSQVFGSPNALQLDGTQVASGQVFQGQVTIPMTLFSADAAAATETYFRLGLIENGDGTGVKINFTDISIVPEPSTCALIGLGIAGLITLRRRQA